MCGRPDRGRGNDGQFARLCQTIGRAELATDPRFVTNSDRVVNRPALEAELERALRTESAAVWEQRLSAVAVPAGLVGTVGEAVERAAALDLDPIIDVGDGRVPQVRHAVRYSVSRAAPPSPPPGLGEHDDLVRAWLDGPGDIPLARPLSAPRGDGTAR